MISNTSFSGNFLATKQKKKHYTFKTLKKIHFLAQIQKTHKGEKEKNMKQEPKKHTFITISKQRNTTKADEATQGFGFSNALQSF